MRSNSRPPINTWIVFAATGLATVLLGTSAMWALGVFRKLPREDTKVVPEPLTPANEGSSGRSDVPVDKSQLSAPKGVTNPRAKTSNPFDRPRTESKKSSPPSVKSNSSGEQSPPASSKKGTAKATKSILLKNTP